MLQRVFLYFVFPMMIIALFLALLGVHRIEFGSDYYNFLKSVSNSLEHWKFEIPSIPKIPLMVEESADTGGKEVIKVLRNFVNFLVKFINVITSIINIIIVPINTIIQVIQFILTLIYQCKDFIGRFRTQFAYV